MVASNVTYPDFSAGEGSPAIRGQFGLQVYYKSGRRVENFIVEPAGMARFRQGTIFSAETRLNQKAFLWEFSFGDNINFILEFTALKLRFHRSGGLVKATSQAITGITQANPAVVTYSGADTFANGDSVWITGVVGMTQVNNREYIVANVNTGANTFELTGVNSTGYTAYSSGGTVEEIIEVTTPYAEADLFDLKFAQFDKTLYIAHPTYHPQKLVYTSATSWAISNHAPVRESLGEYQVITAITKANPAVLTYTGADNFSNGDRVKITGVSGMTEVNDRIFKVANVNTGANTFELQDEDGNNVNSTGYTTYSSGGIVRKFIETAAPFLVANEYPACVGTYEQRLYYGGSNNAPLTLYGSRSADFDDFTLGNEVDDGIEYTVTGEIGRLLWLRGTQKFFALGGAKDVGQATGGVDNVITPTSISIRASNSYGVASINPVSKGTQVSYLQANRLVMRAFKYDLSQDSYVPTDLNTVSEHITKSGLTQTAYQEGRPNIIWHPRTDGVMAAMTTENGESVAGWQRCTTDGTFVSVAALSRSGNYDQVWICGRRSINGVTKHFVEYIADRPAYPAIEDYITIDGDEEADKARWRRMLYEAQKQYIHLDCAISYYGDALGLAAGATMTPSAVSGTGVTFTASAAVFDATMVGREISRKSITGNEFGRARITGYTSSTVVTCEIVEAFNSVAAIPAGEWYLSAAVFANLNQLEGKTVGIVADGAQHEPLVVSGGTITLSRQASVVHVGLKYIGYLETNDLEAPSITGTSQTRRKNVIKVGFRFLDTLYARFGTSYYKLQQIEMRTAAMLMDRPPELFTGDLVQSYVNNTADPREGGWSRAKRAIVVQDQPFPCNVQLIVPYVEAN